MSESRNIVVARGDGIGPEITDAVLEIFDRAGVDLNYHFIEVGEAVYLKGVTSGIAPEAWELLRKFGVILKGPITTPQGKGYKSVNVTLRTSLGLFANVRPFKSYTPYVPSFFPAMDLVIIRENEEDLYTGIEHRQTDEVVQALKLLSRPGTERIVRYAFEYARIYGRKKVTCMTKDNIMKLSDGMFHRVFDEVAREYPGIESDHQIIDIGSARIASRPDRFDIVVTLNLYGDIISDIAADVAGSVGLGGSANIGETAAMFEAIHGSAPDIAGRDIANPSGMLISAIQLLVHIGRGDKAQLIQNAWLATLESGIHTGDVFREGTSTKRVGTKEFTRAVIERLGAVPTSLKSVRYENSRIETKVTPHKKSTKQLLGADLFLCWDEQDRNAMLLGEKIEALASGDLKLQMITNRGVKVFPDGSPGAFCTDHWRCRFMGSGSTLQFESVLELQRSLSAAGLEIVKTENLYSFDGVPGYSLGQGE